ncbi:MAG: tRNA (guanosine(46)-N7)-methyltransferase TrmB [Sulfurimonas sp.]|nr:tRNA (guanosine(46)-N7)-methyltransferase TrmB [Sulfurimonas sp.]
MPHLHIKEFKEIDYPQTVDGVDFHYSVQNLNHKNEMLIAVKVDGDDFFLLAKQDNDKNLLKSDKLTRPPSIYNVHKALLAYAKAAKLEVIVSNVPLHEKNVHLEEVSALKKIDYFVDNFPKNKELRIEVGFGSGRHLLHQAAANPEILFIGIEIHRPSIEQVLKQITIRELENVMVLDYDARLFMELVPSNRVGKVYVHFPVPWDKKPHRRVISTSFIEEANRVLNIGGQLELRTDSKNYYAYSYETFIAFNKTTLQINKNKEIAISSKYEDRWKKMEKNIYDVTMINEEESPVLSLDGNFDFLQANAPVQNIVDLHTKIEKLDGSFIHFERIYSSGETILLRISMGSFDRPEHLYVLVKDKTVSYYPHLPLKSKSNLTAHKYLDGVLHG